MSNTPVNPPEDDELITSLHIPVDMIIDPDRPQQFAKQKTPAHVIVRRCCVAAVWVFAALGAIIFVQAKPVGTNVFMQIKDFTITSQWNKELLNFALAMSAAGVGLGLVCLATWYAFKKKLFFSLLIPFAVSTAICVMLIIL